MVILSRRSIVGLTIAALLWGPAVSSRAQAGASEAEYQVKAAFLYKFLAFVEWPEAVFRGADSPIVIGVLGAEPLAQELSRVVASRSVNGRPVAVRRFSVGDPVADLQVLFVSRAHGPRLAPIQAGAEKVALLTVTESDEGLESGGVINFVIVDDKVRFDVALHRAERAGLRISARLLSVARKVQASPI